jgi:hypothetical protein
MARIELKRIVWFRPPGLACDSNIATTVAHLSCFSPKIHIMLTSRSLVHVGTSISEAYLYLHCPHKLKAMSAYCTTTTTFKKALLQLLSLLRLRSGPPLIKRIHRLASIFLRSPRRWSVLKSPLCSQASQHHSTSTMAKTVKTRIFCISDTHSKPDGDDMSETGSFRIPFPESDILIHSGDLTQTGTPDEYRAGIRLLAQIPAELKLVIAGNHDLSLDKEYYTAQDPISGDYHSTATRIDERGFHPQNAEIAEQIWTGQEAKSAGVTYLTEGIHTFRLKNGAQFTVYASPWQPECRIYFPYSMYRMKANR